LCKSPSLKYYISLFANIFKSFFYKKEVQLRKKQSQDISDAFTKLKDDLDAYNVRFNNFAKEKNEQLTKEISDLNGRLIEVNAKISVLNTVLTASGIGLGVSIFAGAVGM
jgi:uncharacterized coiled-coil DUF342 family protein